MHPYRHILLILAFMVGLLAPLPGQSSQQKKGKEPSRFGWGINLGNIGFSNSTFQFGLGPNIAYKLSEPLAIGLMFKLDYYYVRYRSLDLKFSAFDIGPTLFTRWKPFLNMDGATPFMEGLFFQAEYERAFIARERTDAAGNLILNDEGDRILSERNPEDYVYLGIGAASGYPFSSFISIHYNVNDNIQASRIPFDYRIGFTFHY